jgi:hypothetical protein
VDPPRAGLHKTVLRLLRACDKIKRVVYVACNPASLANDAAALCKPGGARGYVKRVLRAVCVIAICVVGARGFVASDYFYHQLLTPQHNPHPIQLDRHFVAPQIKPFAPVKALAFDLFPHTPHVESVMCLER